MSFFSTIFINSERSDCSYLTQVPLHEVYLAYTPELLLKNINLKQTKTSVRKFNPRSVFDSSGVHLFKCFKL